jgi:hypothetical protein
MKAKQASGPDELRMKADDFDRIMRGALGVPAPEPKPPRKPTAKKSVASVNKRPSKR